MRGLYVRITNGETPTCGSLGQAGNLPTEEPNHKIEERIMSGLIIDLDTGTIIGTNIVVVDSMPDEDMSDSEIIEYGMKHGSEVCF